MSGITVIVSENEGGGWDVHVSTPITHLGTISYNEEIGYVPSPPGEWGLASLHDAAQHVAMAAVKVYFDRRSSENGRIQDRMPPLQTDIRG